MALFSNNTIIDILFKKIGFFTTESKSGSLTGGKQGSEEGLSSLMPVIPSKQIWAQAGLITAPAATASSNNPTVVVDRFTTPVNLIKDPTVSNPSRSWVALKNQSAVPLLGESNRIMNWIMPSIFDPSYGVRVFKNDPNVPANELVWSNPGKEWFFDYQAGVLYWANEGGSPVPSFASLWIKGYTYEGTLGVTGQGSAAKSTIVANLTARDSLTDLSPGDMVYVTDASGEPSVLNGEYAYYLWNGSNFSLIATQDSAIADEGTISIDINALNNVSGNLYNLKEGSRILDVVVQVPANLNHFPSLIVGDSSVNDRFMTSTGNDLTSQSEYISTNNYKVNTNTNITYSYNSGGNTTAGTITLTIFFAS